MYNTFLLFPVRGMVGLDHFAYPHVRYFVFGLVVLQAKLQV